MLKKWGLAFGLTGALLYLGCMLVMVTVGHSGAVKFFNSLLHGLDVSSIIRKSVPLWEAGVGIVETFILSWLVGVCVAGIYNVVFYYSLGKRF
ncbi:MAG: DUF5676 family membrane protein [Ferruginibacter sp.]|jgi:hypothetical protein